MKIEEIEALAERIDSLESELVCERGEYRDGWKNAFQTVREELEAMMRPACPRCGYCGFIEDSAMNLAGVCPECHGTGRAIIRHNKEL